MPNTTLHALAQEIYARHGIYLIVQKKSVKNINFRMRGDTLYVSYPAYVPMGRLLEIIRQKLDWAAAHKKLPKSQNLQSQPKLWGVPLDVLAYCQAHGIRGQSSQASQDALLFEIYRIELYKKLPTLAGTWQPIVGQFANEIRLKRMKTRWGTCNTHDRRVWLSLYLAAYPYECTEYVFVHELCHLIHADHSKDFWTEVKKAMPNYKIWHDLLKGKLD